MVVVNQNARNVMYCQPGILLFTPIEGGCAIGSLVYGPAVKSIPIDDRDLAHLQAVMIAKLRRGESFAFSWEKSLEYGSGHTTVWIHPAMHLEFTYQGSKRVPLNRAWIEVLMTRANSTAGLELVPESVAEKTMAERQPA